MKLRKTIAGSLIRGVYAGFIAVTLYLSILVSGLFPGSDTPVYAAIATGLILAVALAVSVIISKMADKFPRTGTGSGILELILETLVIGGGICLRVIPVILHRMNISGNLGLMETTLRSSAEGAAPRVDLASFVYSLLIWTINIPVGNNELAAFIIQVVLQMVTVLCVYLVLKMTMGSAAAMCGSALLSFFPYMLAETGVLGEEKLVIACFAIELFLMVLMLRGAYEGSWTSQRWAVICFALNGLSVGFLVYMDAGALLVFPLLIMSVFFMRGRSDKFPKPVLPVIVFYISVVLCLILMLVQERGPAGLAEALYGFTGYNFAGRTGYLLLTSMDHYGYYYLAALIMMFFAFTGFGKERENECVSPFMVLTVTVAFAAPFIAVSRLNTGYAMTVIYSLMAGCGIGSVLVKAEPVTIIATGNIVKKRKRKPSLEEKIMEVEGKSVLEGAVEDNTDETAGAEQSAMTGNFAERNTVPGEGSIPAETAAARDNITAENCMEENKAPAEADATRDMAAGSIMEENKAPAETAVTRDNIITGNLAEEKAAVPEPAVSEDIGPSEPVINEKTVSADDTAKEKTVPEASGKTENIISEQTGRTGNNTSSGINRAGGRLPGQELISSGIVRAGGREPAETVISEKVADHPASETDTGKEELYIPEGMVLPIGDEAVDRDLEPRMNMQQMDRFGMVGLKRTAEQDTYVAEMLQEEVYRKQPSEKKTPVKQEQTEEKKAAGKGGSFDFDLDIRDGDDFDI